MSGPLELLTSRGDPTAEASPQAIALGIVGLSVGEGEAVMKVGYRPDLVGDPETGVLAGGVITTLLDHACGRSVWAALEAFTTIATLDLRIDYMRAAEPGLDVFARAHCYKLTRSVAFVRATAWDRDEADPVAAAQAVFMLAANAGRPFGANLRDRPAREDKG